jgi:hypothetical protein
MLCEFNKIQIGRTFCIKNSSPRRKNSEQQRVGCFRCSLVPVCKSPVIMATSSGVGLALCIALVALLCTWSNADTTVASVSYSTPLCGDDFAMGNEHTYAYKQNSHPLCMVINNQSKAVFYPSVDVFTLLEIKNCNAFQSVFYFCVSKLTSCIFAAWGVTVGNNTFFHVELPGWRTTDVYVSKKTNVLVSNQWVGQQVTAPFLTILITLSAGQVAGVEFDPDSSCSTDTRCTADPSLCLDNAFCGVASSQCVTSTSSCSNTTVGVSCFDCNLKVPVFIPSRCVPICHFIVFPLSDLRCVAGHRFERTLHVQHGRQAVAVPRVRCGCRLGRRCCLRVQLRGRTRHQLGSSTCYRCDLSIMLFI